MEFKIGELFTLVLSGWNDPKTGEPVVIPLPDVYYSGKSYPFGDTILWKLERALADGTTTSYLKTTEEVRKGLLSEDNDLGNKTMKID
jgi:hypothetical protein